MHFSEIIKLQFEKKKKKKKKKMPNTAHCFVFYCFFESVLLNYLCKMRGYPQFSFWISIALAKVLSYTFITSYTLQEV